ncbi:hypothetical protein B0H11DRAFT_2215535 [Mycena galericulata]|nr:hypothetical protein B0H11DRAFT_2215535 [Mycena galericulata]
MTTPFSLLSLAQTVEELTSDNWHNFKDEILIVFNADGESAPFESSRSPNSNTPKSRRLGVSSFRNIPTAMKSTTGIVPKSGNELKVGETRREGAQRECLEANSMMGLQGGREVVVKTVF